jgi:autotransporter-associated beta strand protein
MLTLFGENTYTGTTTIEEGRLYIGWNNGLGSIAGNIVNNDELYFHRSGSYTYSGIISGTGAVEHFGYNPSNVLTLTGVNTYTGRTYITEGTLVLGANGAIANSSDVLFKESTAKLDISAGNKTIKKITGTNANHEIILGSNTLTIGTAGQDDGDGEFKGKFTGTGGVTKTGNGTLTMNGANAATGLFTLSQGKMEFSNKWAGNLNIAAGATIDIKGDVIVGGTLNMLGGKIFMNLTAATPSKISVTGAASAAGTNTLHITSGEVTNEILIQAASGLNSVAPYTLNMPGYNASLEALGTLLLLTATATDVTPPTPGAGIFGTTTDRTAELNWVAATDNDTPQENLRYFVYQSSNDDITTVADCEENGTLLNEGGSIHITEYTVSDLTSEETYYFNVVVIDMANNKAAYEPVELGTNYEPAVISIEISPKSVTLPMGATQQFTATVVAVGGADESVMWTVAGITSLLTSISADGLLTIGSNEAAASITVKATSNFDPNIFDEVTVTIGDVAIEQLTIDNEQLTIYPNPTSGQLTIDNGRLTIVNVEIFDAMGKRHEGTKARKHESDPLGVASTLRLDVSHLPSGVYFIRITTDNGVVTRKVVKQ